MFPCAILDNFSDNSSSPVLSHIFLKLLSSWTSVCAQPHPRFRPSGSVGQTDVLSWILSLPGLSNPSLWALLKPLLLGPVREVPLRWPLGILQNLLRTSWGYCLCISLWAKYTTPHSLLYSTPLHFSKASTFMYLFTHFMCVQFAFSLSLSTLF